MGGQSRPLVGDLDLLWRTSGVNYDFVEAVTAWIVIGWHLDQRISHMDPWLRILLCIWTPGEVHLTILLCIWTPGEEP